MSIVDDQIRHLDALLDKYQISAATSRGESTAGAEVAELTQAVSIDGARTTQLKTVVRALSTTSSSRPLLKRRRLRDLLTLIQRSEILHSQSTDETDLEWFATAKATVQVYGLILNSLLEQTIPLSESIWYWDDVLGSYGYTGLYTLQTSPIRFWNSTKEIYADAKTRYQSNMSVREAAEQSTQSITEGWKEFYTLVQQSIQERSLAQARTRILSPFAVCRMEARKKQNGVKKLREQSATAIGLLVDEGLTFNEHYEANHDHEWRITVTKSISLLEGLLKHSTTVDNTISDFEYNVIESVDQENSEEMPQLAVKLIQILDHYLPEQEQSSKAMTREFGKPSRLIRYWIPGLALFLSGGTLLRIFANRREDIQNWVRELGATTIDFWYNWVVEPTKRLIGTIRHDKDSELAVMSRDSLRSDRESLERMVVDFATKHPENGSGYSELDIETIRSKVREGDLTPVLRAYERDLQSPAKGVLFGNLVQALLIQVQKTKVDVEVAMDGIDSILKSQELLFGFVGIAPGILISYLAFRYLSETFSNRSGLNRSKRQGETVRLLRNIDRVLSNAAPTENGVLSYKDHGLLLCEIYVLRERAATLLPGYVQREFLEDLHDLMDIRQGIHQQIKVVHRLQWAYAKWLK